MKPYAWIGLAAGLLGLPCAATAGARASASYTIPADTVAAGGQPAGSACYSLLASAGSIGGSATSAPARAVRHGYPGQLYEARALDVTAPATNVNENATLQMAATLTLDDGTWLGLAPAWTRWIVVSGPISSVTAGLARAMIVYQDTQAVVRGEYQAVADTLGLLVINTNNDDYGVYAVDGLNDAWQVGYFGENNPVAKPDADPDGDRQDNAFEYVAGTSPTNAASLFAMSLEWVPEKRNWLNLIFSPRWTSRAYSVQAATNWRVYAVVPGGATNDAGSRRTVTDTNATSRMKTYRVQIAWP